MRFFGWRRRKERNKEIDTSGSYFLLPEQREEILLEQNKSSAITPPPKTESQRILESSLDLFITHKLKLTISEIEKQHEIMQERLNRYAESILHKSKTKKTEEERQEYLVEAKQFILNYVLTYKAKVGLNLEFPKGFGFEK